MCKACSAKSISVFCAMLLMVTSQASVQDAVGGEQVGMVFVPARRFVVGNSEAERRELAKRFDCHPTWLNDDLLRHEAAVETFGIDRFPVTNAQYLAFVEATGHPRPGWWNRWGGAFPVKYADHPVVGLNGPDAVAYAKWVGNPWRWGTLRSGPGFRAPNHAACRSKCLSNPPSDS